MSAQFIFTMRDLRRFYPPDREVLKGINLSFYPGAKIGIIGNNGSGKSSLLKIMAGLDDGFSGEARLTPGFTVGFLSQEPELDPSKDVLGNVSDGVAEARDLLARFDEVNASFADPDADFDALLAEQAQLQDRIDALGAWELQRTLDVAMDALRLPAPDADVTNLSGGERRRVALCRLLLSKPDLLLLDEPTNHLDAETVAWLERALKDYAGTVVAVTHDRYFLDNVAGWIEGPGSPGRATTRRGSSRSRHGSPPRRRLTRPGSRRSNASSSGSGCLLEPGSPRARPASTPSTSSSPRPRPSSNVPIASRSPSRRDPASATSSSTPGAS